LLNVMSRLDLTSSRTGRQQIFTNRITIPPELSEIKLKFLFQIGKLSYLNQAKFSNHTTRIIFIIIQLSDHLYR